jgi:uncharacterized membrane protein
MKHKKEATLSKMATSHNETSVKTRYLYLFLLLFFTTLYNFSFWNENLGLNLFIFSTLILATLCYIFRQNLPKNQLAWLLLSGTILSSLTVLYHNTLNSKIAWLISFIATTAALKAPNLHILLNAWIFSLINFFSSLGGIYKEASQLLFSTENKSSKSRKISKNLRLAIIPAGIFIVFYVIFLIANPVFKSYNSQIFDKIITFVEYLIGGVSFERIIFIFFGFWIVSAIIYRWNIDQKFNRIRIWGTDFINRKKKVKQNLSKKIVEITENQEDSQQQIQVLFKNLDLKNEVQMAFLVVASVNLLLLVVNIIDIRFLWFGFNPSPNVNLASLVHQGTYMLIFSILLSMAILMYYFRYNINFYKKNTTLKNLAIIWLIQNGILIISVFFRCYYYISQYGFAYKRIGVVLFLFLTIIGLITFYIKIKNKKSVYYLLRVNSLAAYVMLVAMSFVNWDNFIVSQNLNHPNWIQSGDVYFTTSRSDSTLPILYENLNKINTNLDSKSFNSASYLHNRKEDFIRDYESKSWLSWNASSANVYERLKR